MANTTRLSCFDFILFGGVAYMYSELADKWENITCEYKIKEWMMWFYFLLPTLRIVLYVYCISKRLARCAKYALLAVLMPLTAVFTLAGQVIYSKSRSYEPLCMADA